MKLDLLREMNRERAARRAVILVTDTAEGGSQRLVREAEAGSDPLAAELMARFRSGKSGIVEAEGRSLFLTVQVPPPTVPRPSKPMDTGFKAIPLGVPVLGCGLRPIRPFASCS